MKIPFDVKYRPQIESGEYKVQTADGRDVRIICWDKKVYGGRIDIVALVPAIATGTECIQVYNPDGTLESRDPVGKFKLTIITPEPGLTEFEKALADVVGFAVCQSVVDPNYETYKFVKDWSERLLDAAKKELCKDCVANLEGYIKVRQDALKEMDESRVYKHEGPTPPAYWPPCYFGGACTTPFYDCINCHRQSTGRVNTTTGTSTAKVEGKE